MRQSREGGGNLGRGRQSGEGGGNLGRIWGGGRQSGEGGGQSGEGGGQSGEGGGNLGRGEAGEVNLGRERGRRGGGSQSGDWEAIAGT